MMGHSSIASTQIYAQITDQKIARDMNKLMRTCKEVDLYILADTEQNTRERCNIK